MAWNQPGKGKQNPWGAPSPGGGMDAMLQRLRELFGGGNPLGWLLPLLALLLLFNSFKLVDERQRGVVLRFGKFDRIMTPGANFKWPWPVESVTMIDATNVEKLDDQVRLFATRLGEGHHEFAYIVRATTAGAYSTAPAHAEEMYEPEVFGRTATAAIDVRK